MTPRAKTAVRFGALCALVLMAVFGSRLVSGQTAVAPANYAENVAPILMTHCVGCHRDGGIAPFSLLTYEQTKAHGAAIKAAIQSRHMPPFNLDNSGSCQTYSDARWLADAEIATIASWVDEKMPLGDAKKVPPPPPAPPGLDRVDLTVDMGVDYTPAGSGTDDYRCFVIDPGLEQDRFVTAFELHPGEPRMVHHLTLFALDTPEAEREAAKLDSEEPGPGYTCFGDTRVDSRWLVGAGPGSGVHALPAGTGLKMRAGRKTVLQMHYSRTQGTFPDRTKIDLKLEPRVDHEAFIGNLANYDIELPPGRREISQSAVQPVPEADTLLGLWPHMHLMGRKLNITLRHAGKEQCLAQVNDWDFHWQGFANYAKPIALDADDELRITCTYDTAGRQKKTTWGSKTDDEMCIAFLYLVPR